MKEKEIQNCILEHMDYRLDQIERLVTLSLMNDILPQYINDLSEKLSDDIVALIKDLGFSIVRAEIFSDKIAVYLHTEKKVGIKEFRDMKRLFSEEASNLVLVFELEKANITQKRKFMEEKISYHIVGKELFISKD